MRGALAVAQNTFIEAVRDRFFWVTLFFALFLFLIILFLGSLSIRQEGKIIADFGLAAIALLSTLLLVFLPVVSWKRELEGGTAQIVLAKPVSREGLLLGKFLGFALVFSLLILLLGTVLVALLYWQIRSFNPFLLWALFLQYVELLLLLAVVLMFSTFLSLPLSILSSVAVYFIGHLSFAVRFLPSIEKSPFSSAFFEMVYRVFPSLEYFNVRNSAVYGQGVPLPLFLFALLYAFSYIVVSLLVTVWFLRRKDF